MLGSKFCTQSLVPSFFFLCEYNPLNSRSHICNEYKFPTFSASVRALSIPKLKPLQDNRTPYNLKDLLSLDLGTM
ncbi:hypothetical protein RJT34_32016 [Clitoria ternatea]|uniref:Uncharacterized protein n=1 Tax=Clitoria ternatea TaxID=43366 RepID=A0AAN9EV90_CLITE